MSFDVNIGRAEPVIKAAASMNNDGGSGGNTGYMGGGGRQKREEKRSLFDKSKDKSDSFELTSGLKTVKEFSEQNTTKSWLKKLFFNSNQG